MTTPSNLTLELTDVPRAADLDVVDAGLHASNLAAADLDAVQPLAVFARDAAGAVVAGLRARTWGRAAEIQQLWVRPDLRLRGLGLKLMETAEAALVARGCTLVYLETFSWQAPWLYLRCGFEIAAQFDGMPRHGVKYVMHKQLAAAPLP
ncbi:MAG: GNAT family N-acetyltransferase [Burkholderiaceae bacterium]|nr:GNAT family N-acetyltransferase [Burkholderiaceae bacterium]